MFGDAFKKDLEKYYRIHFRVASPTFRSKLRLWISSHGLHCVAAYRLGQFAREYRKQHPLPGTLLVIIHKIIDCFITTFYHIEIAAQIGPGFYIGHVGTIYIGPTVIGDNFSITHNVTIGVGHAKLREGIPKKIGNNVWIGTGASLYGEIVIGNDVTIATGCALSRDVPDGCLMGGNPGRMILRNYDNSSLFGGEKPLSSLPEPTADYLLPTEESRASTTAPPQP